MTTVAAEAIRQAALRFADELVAALDAAKTDDGPDELLDAPATCQRLGGIARSTLYTLPVRSIRVRGRRFWPASAVAEYIAAQSPPDAR